MSPVRKAKSVCSFLDMTELKYRVLTVHSSLWLSTCLPTSFVTPENPRVVLVIRIIETPPLPMVTLRSIPIRVQRSMLLSGRTRVAAKVDSLYLSIGLHVLRVYNDYNTVRVAGSRDREHLTLREGDGASG